MYESTLTITAFDTIIHAPDILQDAYGNLAFVTGMYVDGNPMYFLNMPGEDIVMLDATPRVRIMFGNTLEERGFEHISFLEAKDSGRFIPAGIRRSYEPEAFDDEEVIEETTGPWGW